MWIFFLYFLFGIAFAHFETKDMKKDIASYQAELDRLMKLKNESEDFIHRMKYRSMILDLDKENESLLNVMRILNFVSERSFYRIAFCVWTLLWWVKLVVFIGYCAWDFTMSCWDWAAGKFQR